MKQVENTTYRILLCGGNFLNAEGVVQQTVTREVLAYILLDKLDTKIGVVDALDLVANAGDCE